MNNKLTRRAPMPSVVRRLHLVASDPMWADHVECSKSLLLEAAEEIKGLVAELCYAQGEASGACAELSSAAIHGDIEYAVRDSKCAVHTLVSLQKRISDFIDGRAAIAKATLVSVKRVGG